MKRTTVAIPGFSRHSMHKKNSDVSHQMGKKITQEKLLYLSKILTILESEGIC